MNRTDPMWAPEIGDEVEFDQSHPCLPEHRRGDYNRYRIEDYYNSYVWVPDGNTYALTVLLEGDPLQAAEPPFTYTFRRAYSLAFLKPVTS